MINHLKILDQLTCQKEKGTSYKIIDNICYIAGSNDSSDWAVNLNATIEGKYHKGFLNEAKRLIIPSSVKTIIGYSQGAAIANIVAIERSIEAIGFATPGYCLKKTKNANVTNYRLSSDPIWLSPFQVDNLQAVGSSKRLRVSHHCLETYLYYFSKGVVNE